MLALAGIAAIFCRSLSACRRPLHCRLEKPTASPQRSPETQIDHRPDGLRRRPPCCFSVASWSLRTRRHGVISDFEWTFVHFGSSTIGEFVPGYEASGWLGIGAPANTPPQIIAILNKLVNEALASAEFKARFVDLGLEPFATSPAEFGKFIVDYTEKWGKVIRAANIKPN